MSFQEPESMDIVGSVLASGIGDIGIRQISKAAFSQIAAHGQKMGVKILNILLLAVEVQHFVIWPRKQNGEG